MYVVPVVFASKNHRGFIMFLAELTRGSTNYSGQAIVFSFDYLWNLTLDLNKTDPHSPSLFHPHDNQTRLCLTYDACVRAVGAANGLYSRRDIYDRVLLWRVPLIALVATTTLPTLVSIAIPSYFLGRLSLKPKRAVSFSI